MIRVVSTAPDKPAARANGTVRPSDIPMTMSRTVSVPVKWRSVWSVWGMGGSYRFALISRVKLRFTMQDGDTIERQ